MVAPFDLIKYISKLLFKEFLEGVVFSDNKYIFIYFFISLQQEPPVSRESSPANVLGVKLKIKIGGSTGPSSMMVTGESSSATPSPSSLVGSKRDSVSPHKIIPKLWVVCH